MVQNGSVIVAGTTEVEQAQAANVRRAVAPAPVASVSP